MTISKKFMAVAAAAALTAATAVPALALENEFHGMYRVYGMESNFNTGNPPGTGFKKDAPSGFVAYQRARIMYTAKANDDLKMVTHFELDTRFGGQQVNTPAAFTGATGPNGYKGSYNGNDAGALDADSISLETKNAYLDFNIPTTGVNVKVGIHNFTDSYQWVFSFFDGTGVTLTKKFAPLTLKGGWFRLQDLDTNSGAGVVATATSLPGKRTTDLIFVDGNYAVSKSLSVGASYYNVQRDSAGPGFTNEFELLHLVGFNADIKAGPVAIKPFLGYEFGDANPTGAVKNDISAFLAGFVSKTKVGPGDVNISSFYTSGDKDGTGKAKDFKNLGQATSYFGAANMWLLIRHPMGIAEQDSLGTDITAGDRGLIGVFAGYAGTAGKVFYSGNVGHMRTAEQRTIGGVKEAASLGYEINATVGYKMYDNLSASFNTAYLFLGDALSHATANKRIGIGNSTTAKFGAADADDPYLMNVMLNYAF